MVPFFSHLFGDTPCYHSTLPLRNRPNSRGRRLPRRFLSASASRDLGTMPPLWTAALSRTLYDVASSTSATDAALDLVQTFNLKPAPSHQTEKRPRLGTVYVMPRRHIASCKRTLPLHTTLRNNRENLSLIN